MAQNSKNFLKVENGKISRGHKRPTLPTEGTEDMSWIVEYFN